MVYCRDSARVLHTFEFITEVHRVRSEHPHYTPDHIAKTLQVEVYHGKHNGVYVTHMDVQLALYILRDECPVWEEGELFYYWFKGIPVERDNYKNINKPNFKNIKYLALRCAAQVQSIKNQYNKLWELIAVIDKRRNLYHHTPYWKYASHPVDDAVINLARKMVIRGLYFKPKRLYRLWCVDVENPSIPLRIHRLRVPGCRNAVRVYLHTRNHKLGLCAKRGFLRME